jgi:hypothetical protein
MAEQKLLILLLLQVLTQPIPSLALPTHTEGTGSTIYGPTTTPPTAAGTYSITPSAATFVDAASAAKYSTITYTAGSFTIDKKALTVTPTNQNIVYGSCCINLLWCYRLCQ